MESGHWRFSSWSLWEERGEIYLGNAHRTDTIDERVSIFQTTLTAERALSDQWAVSFDLPYRVIRRRIGTTGLNQHFEGFGDFSTLLNYEAPFGNGKDPSWRWGFDAGLSWPTGEIERPSLDSGGAPLSTLQLGTGTVDPLLGLRLGRRAGPWDAYAHLSAKLPFHENRNHYETGDTEVLEVGLSRSLSSAWSLSTRLIGVHRGRDKVRGDRTAVGGGERLAIAPGLSWAISPTWSLAAEVQLPIWRDFETAQLDSKITYGLGISVRF